MRKRLFTIGILIAVVCGIWILSKMYENMYNQPNSKTFPEDVHINNNSSCPAASTSVSACIQHPNGCTWSGDKCSPSATKPLFFPLFA